MSDVTEFRAGALDISIEDDELVIKLSDDQGNEVEARMDKPSACKFALAILKKAGHPAGAFYAFLGSAGVDVRD